MKLTAVVRATIQRDMSCIVSAVRDLDEVRRRVDRLALTSNRKVAQKSVLRLYCPHSSVAVLLSRYREALTGGTGALR